MAFCFILKEHKNAVLSQNRCFEPSLLVASFLTRRATLHLFFFLCVLCVCVFVFVCVFVRSCTIQNSVICPRSTVESGCNLNECYVSQKREQRREAKRHILCGHAAIDSIAALVRATVLPGGGIHVMYVVSKFLSCGKPWCRPRGTRVTKTKTKK